MQPLRIGHYAVIEELGRGSQGVVYVAEDSRLSRRVALKVLSTAQIASESGSSSRLHREVEAVSRVQHPGVCALYETGTEGEHTYIAMGLVLGETLAQRIAAAEAPPDPGAACALIEQVARALHAAHERGVLHRDVKPHNVIVPADGGHPVLLDFGLAQLEQGHGQTLTATGAIVGTPAYLAPELILGSRLPHDRRTDVYALGVTLYELLTLHRPFGGATRDALYRDILTSDPPDPRRWNPALTADAVVILRTALAKDPDRRYATAADLADDLGRLQRGEPIAARTPSVGYRLSRWVRRRPAQAVALVLAFLLFGVAPSLFGFVLHGKNLELERSRNEALDEAAKKETQRRRAEAEKERARRASEEAENRREEAEAAREAAVEAESQALAERDRAERARLAANLMFAQRLVDEDQVEAAKFLDDAENFPPDQRDFTWGVLSRRLPVLRTVDGSTRGRAVFGSSSDRFIRCLDDDRTLTVGWALGEELARTDVEHAGDIRCLARSTTGLLASGDSEGEIRLWRVETDEFEPVGDPIHTGPAVRRLAFSPGGEMLAAAQGGRITIWRVPEGELIPRLIDAHPEPIQGVAWSGDGLWLATIARKELRVWKVGSWEAHGDPPALPPGSQFLSLAASPGEGVFALGFTGGRVQLLEASTLQITADWKLNEAGIRALAYSADGRTLAAATEDRQIFFLDPVLGATRGVLRVPGRHDEPAWTTMEFAGNGRAVLVAGDGGEMHIVDALRQDSWPHLRTHGAPITVVAVARDGRHVVTGDGGGTAMLRDQWLLAPWARLEGHEGGVQSAAFSPDGNALVTGDGSGTVRRWGADTGALLASARLHEGRVNGLAFLPDGELLSFGEDGRVLCTPVPAEAPPAVISERDVPALCALTSADGRTLASGWADGQVCLWAADDVTAHLREPDSALAERTLQGAVPAAIHAIAFPPDAGGLAAGDASGRLLLWPQRDSPNPEAPNPVAPAPREVKAHEGAVTNLIYSRAGKTLVSAGADGALKTWDTEYGYLHATLARKPGPLRGLALLHGHTVVSGSPSGTLHPWKSDAIDARDALHALARRSAIALSPDGELVVVARGAEPPVIVPRGGGGPRVELARAEVPVRCLAFSSTGETVFAGGWNGEIGAWDVATGERLQVLRGHTGGVVDLAVSPDGLLASAGWDGSVRLWDESGSEHSVLTGHEGAVLAVCHLPGGERLASAGRDGAVCIWEVATGRCLHRLERHQSPVVALTATAPNLLASADADTRILVWNADSGALRRELGHRWGSASVLAFTAEGSRLISGGGDSILRFELEESLTSGAWEVEGLTWRDMVHDPLRDQVLIAPGRHPEADPLVQAVDLGDGLTLQRVHCGLEQVMVLAGSPTDDLLATASSSRSVHVVSPLLGTRLELAPHETAVEDLAFTRNGDALVIADQKRVVVREWATGEVMATIIESARKNRRCWLVAASPTADLVVAVSRGRNPRLICSDLFGGRVAQRDLGRTPVTALAFAPDGGTLTIARDADPLVFLDTSDWTPRDLSFDPERRVHDLDYSPDGALLAVTDRQGVTVLDTESAAVNCRLVAYPGEETKKQVMESTFTGAEGGWIAMTTDQQHVLLFSRSGERLMQVSHPRGGTLGPTYGITSLHGGELLCVLDGFRVIHVLRSPVR